MNAYNLIAGATHSASGQFSDYWEFISFVKNKYGNLPYDKKELSKVLDVDIKSVSSQKQQAISNAIAFNFLVAEDLKKIQKRLSDLPEREVFLQKIEHYHAVILEHFTNLGMSFSAPNYYIVDKFPEPYSVMDWVAFAPDLADEQDFGIPAGLYLLESELASYYSELTLAHEMVHAVVGNVNPRLLGRGLEEGIAEILGTLYMGCKLFSREIAKNVFIHTRLGSQSTQANNLYLDYTRQAGLIYKKFGLEGLIFLANGGREAIKQTEELCLKGDFQLVDLPAGKWDDDLNNIIDYLLISYTPNMVVSPLAYHLSKYVKPGLTINEIALLSKVNIENVRSTLDEIQSRIFGVLVSDSTIVYSDLEFILRSGSLRYEVLNNDTD